MIYGIGIDIIKTARLKSAVERWGERFLRRVFTDGELSYAYRKSDPYLSLSVRFAAKEALIKAVGTGVPIRLTEIEVTGSGGKPGLAVKGGLQSFFQENAIRTVHLSLSHEQEYGVACVVLETDGGNS